ncbi:GNAT family N-acetyltransferase [Flavobacteriaceae bacterium LMO-SS05]
MNLSYKICNEKDLQTLVEISKSTFISAFEKQNNPEDFKTHIHKAFSKTQLQEELLDPNVRFYFVYRNNTLVGYFKLNEKEAQTEPFGETSMEIERIYVLDGFQGQHIGQHMLNHSIEIAKQKQLTFIWLGVWELNTAAIRFYERYGFVKFDMHPYYIGNDKQTDWLMRLDLI